MSLSPVSAISDMVAPVVLITVATFIGNGFMTAGTAVRDRIFALNRERLGILGGPHGEILDEDSLPPIDRERMTQIRNQMPLLITRARLPHCGPDPLDRRRTARAQRGRYRCRRHRALRSFRLHGAGAGHRRGRRGVRWHRHGDRPDGQVGAYDELVGTLIFEAFPDNPNDSEATGVANLNASFERVFRHARRDHMPLQRYDIPSADAEAAFVRKFWTPVNSPLCGETGRVIGALHHVEDVTAIAEVAESVRESGPSALSCLKTEQESWNALVAALAREVLGHQQARRTAEQLQQALSSRILIEQAKGMIAAREGIGVDQAFVRLRQHARRHNARVHDVARAVVELGLPV